RGVGPPRRPSARAAAARAGGPADAPPARRRPPRFIGRREGFFVARERPGGRPYGRIGVYHSLAMRPVRVRNATRGSTVAGRAEIAASPLRRLVGLIGRRGWGDTDGLLIRPCKAIHTWFMRMPI